MGYKFKISKIINFFVIFLYGSNAINATEISQNRPYIFTYISHTPSLGLVLGTKIVTVLIKKDYIDAIDLATGSEIAEKDIPYLQIILQAIKKYSNKYLVTYDTYDFPKKITSKIFYKMVGNTFTINILTHEIVDNNYVLDGQKLRVAYFEENFQKWQALKKEKYSFNYQDKNPEFNNTYIDGLYAEVENDKVIFLRDTFHYKQIDLSQSHKIITINQLFNLIKRRLNGNKEDVLKVFYNEEYGYPYYIMNQQKKSEKIEIFLHNLK